MRILLIEDDRSVSKALQQGLRSSYTVDSARTGIDGLRNAQNNNYDVILLDLNLPDLSGENICRRLRKNKYSVPIIIISGRDLTEDKVLLLDMGANDYITKPFRIEEVKARIRVVLRHGSKVSSKPKLHLGTLELDPAGRTVRVGDTSVSLRRKEFDLLEYLMRHPSQTLTRSMILENIWEVSENLWANVVDVHIKHLRDKIDRPFGTKLIRTVHGVGYKLEINESV